jgi:hypothetical protein
MGLTNLLPRTINTTGVSCTGSDGGSNRTYTLPDSSVLSSGIDIVVSGTTLLEGAGNDFTMSGSIITFLNALWNDSVIRVNYFITYGAPAAATLLSTSTSLKYITPLMFAEALGIIKEIPSWDVSGTPTNEAVGTGNGVATEYYLDQKSVISDSYTLYAAGTAMTDVTHYVLDTDTGKITLTAAGVALLASGALTAKYSYYSNGMKDSFIQAVLSRAEKEVDKSVNSTFTDGTQTNPAWPIEEEIQPSQGYFQERVIIEKKPLRDIESALDGNITAIATSISLESAQGGEQFPTAGYIIIGSEIINYTGVTTDTLTGCSRGVLGTTAATHSNGDAVHSTIVFRSSTEEGTTVAWTVQPWQTSMFANEEGLIYTFTDADPDQLSKAGVAERIKVIYLYGYDTVPGDITRLTLLYAKRQLIQDNIGKAMIAGRNEFRPEMMNVDEEEMRRIVGSYIVLPMGNT